MFLTEKTPSAKKSSKIKAFSHSKKYFCEYLTRADDDLGRVVVPKELRRTMKISEGTPLEIFIDKDGSIIFRKYSPVGELNESAKNMASASRRQAASHRRVRPRPHHRNGRHPEKGFAG